MNAACQHLVLARFNASPQEMVELRGAVQGEAASVAELPALADTALLRKYYKIDDSELKIGSIPDAIVTRIAARDCL